MASRSTQLVPLDGGGDTQLRNLVLHAELRDLRRHEAAFEIGMRLIIYAVAIASLVLAWRLATLTFPMLDGLAEPAPEIVVGSMLVLLLVALLHFRRGLAAKRNALALRWSVLGLDEKLVTSGQNADVRHSGPTIPDKRRHMSS